MSRVCVYIIHYIYNFNEKKRYRKKSIYIYTSITKISTLKRDDRILALSLTFHALEISPTIYDDVRLKIKGTRRRNKKKSLSRLCVKIVKRILQFFLIFFGHFIHFSHKTLPYRETIPSGFVYLLSMACVHIIFIYLFIIIKMYSFSSDII